MAAKIESTKLFYHSHLASQITAPPVDSNASVEEDEWEQWAMERENILPPPERVLIPGEVRNAAALGKLAFFVGNGISRLYGMPSWEELCSKMFSALADSNVIDHNKVDLLTRQSLKARMSIADHYFQKFREINKELTYASLLRQSRESSAYASLAKCGVKFVTTNYDNLLSSALEGANKISAAVQSATVATSAKATTHVDKPTLKTVRVYGDPYKFEKALKNNVVFHLHGYVNDESTIIASTASYLKLYSDPNVQSFLKWFFENHVVVFVGYGLEELELLDLIVRSGTPALEDQQKHSFFLLLPLLSHEAEVLEQIRIYYDQLGITLLPFSRDQKGYAAYADVLETWSSELAQRTREPTRVDSLQLIDALINEFEGNVR